MTMASHFIICLTGRRDACGFIYDGNVILQSQARRGSVAGPMSSSALTETLYGDIKVIAIVPLLQDNNTRKISEQKGRIQRWLIYAQDAER